MPTARESVLCPTMESHSYFLVLLVMLGGQFHGFRIRSEIVLFHSLLQLGSQVEMLEELLSFIKHRIASGMSGRLAAPGKGNQNSVQSCSSSSLSLAVLEGRWYGCEHINL